MVILRPIVVSDSFDEKEIKEIKEIKEAKEVRIGCSIPCHLCRRQIVEMDMTVHAVTNSGTWFHGKLTDDAAPPSKFTHGQVKIKEKKSK